MCLAQSWGQARNGGQKDWPPSTTPGWNAGLFHDQEMPMTPPQRRPLNKVLNFEGHSVQLIAAWTLAIAGLAHTPPGNAGRSGPAGTTNVSSSPHTRAPDTLRVGDPLPRRSRGPGVN